MFNGYNDAPLISYNEFEQEGEKKQDNAPKWSYGHVAGVPTHAQSRQSEYWLSKSNIFEITAPIHAPPKCNCSECYSSENNSYQSDSIRNRSWLPRRIPVPVNGASESCKLPGNHQWNNIGLTNPQSCMIGNNIFAAQHAQHIGGKNPFHKSFQGGPVAEFHQPGVITSVKSLPPPDGHIFLKDKSESSANPTIQEMAFYGQNSVRQPPGFCPPTHDLTRNLEKRLDNRNCDPNFYELNEKYSNINHFRHSSHLTSCPLDSHVSRPPVVEPYLKAVPLNLNQNRVPLNGHRNFKENLPKSCTDESLLRSGVGSRKMMNSDGYQDENQRHERMVFQMTKDGMLAETIRTQQQLQGLPSSIEADFKNNQIVMDYSRFSVNRDLPKHYENKLEAETPKKFFTESDGRQLDYFPRNSLSDSTKKNGQNFFQEGKKDCVVNQLSPSEQSFGSFNRLNQNSEINFLESSHPKASFPVYYTKESQNVEKMMKPEKCGIFQKSPSLIHRNGQNFFKNENPGFNSRLNRPPLFMNEIQDHCFTDRRQNSFPYQSSSAAACRNFVRPDYSCQSYSVSNRHDYPHPFNGNTFLRNDGNHVNHRSMPQRMPDCGSVNSTSFVSSGNNSFVFDSYYQPAGNFDKSQQICPETEQSSSGGIQMYPAVPHIRIEEPRIDNLCESKETTQLESVKSKNFNKNGSSKISPLRLLRKKKSSCQKNEMISTSPVPKINSESAPALDVRKFWSTWADEEEDNTSVVPTSSATHMVVLDCQNINPEQAEFLQLYESHSVNDLNLKNNSLVSPKSSQGGEKFTSESSLIEDNVKELNSIDENFSFENGMKINSFEIKKDINENRIESAELEKLYQKNSTPPPFDSDRISITVKDELNKPSNINDAGNANGVLHKNVENSENQNLDNFDKIAESHFEFLKMPELGKENHSSGGDENHPRTKENKDGFLYQEKIVSDNLKSPKNIMDEIAEEKIETGTIGNGEMPEKVLSPGMESGKGSNVNLTRDETSLDNVTSSPLIDDDPSPNDSLECGKYGLPNLPTSEYRRNKFLDYTDGKFSVDGEISVSSTRADKVMKISGGNEDISDEVIEGEVDAAIPKNEISSVTNKCYERECLSKGGLTSLNNNPSDELSKNEIRCFKSESEIKDVKLKNETGLEDGFEIDHILRKFSKIDFDKLKTKSEIVADDVSKAETDSVKPKFKKILSRGKNMKRHKKKPKLHRLITGETDKVVEKDDSLLKHTVEFSIRKSHDLKISFKVLNNQGGSTKCEGNFIDVGTKKSPKEEAETSPKDLEVESATFDLKGLKENIEFRSEMGSDTKKNFRKEKILLNGKLLLNNDSSAVEDHSVLKEKDRNGENHDPLAKVVEEDVDDDEDDGYVGDHPLDMKSSNYFSTNDFQVEESIDSAKIKLTFKRNKRDFDCDPKVQEDSKNGFDPEDIRNSKEDPPSFSSAISAGSTPRLDSLSDVEFAKPESKSEDTFKNVADSKEVPHENQLNFVSEDSSSMSLVPRILNGESQENGKKIVKYSKCSSVDHFTYLQPHIIGIDGKNQNHYEEESFLEKLDSKKISDDDDGDDLQNKNRLDADENLLTEILEESDFVSCKEFCKKNAGLIERNISVNQLIGKVLINCEDGDRLYNKYCKSPLLTDPDTLTKGENLSKVRFEEANSKDTLSDTLRCDAEKDESLAVTKEPKNCSFNLDQNTHKTEKTLETTGGSILDKNSTDNKKNDEDAHQLFPEQDPNAKTGNFQTFESFNWSNCSQSEKEISANTKSPMDFHFENNYCPSQALDLEIFLEKKKPEGAAGNSKTAPEAKDAENEKNVTSDWSQNLTKPMTIDSGYEISVEDPLFGLVKPFRPPSKNETIGVSERRWFNPFNAVGQPEENDNNNFEFIIDSSGKIVPSDAKKIQNYTNLDNAKIDEINEALEAIFKETEKTCENFLRENKNPVRPHKECQNDGLAKAELKKDLKILENVLRESEEAPKILNFTAGDCEDVASHGVKVKDRDEITQSNCDSVVFQPETEVTKTTLKENNEMNKADVVVEFDGNEKIKAYHTNDNESAIHREESESNKFLEEEKENLEVTGKNSHFSSEESSADSIKIESSKQEKGSLHEHTDRINDYSERKTESVVGTKADNSENLIVCENKKSIRNAITNATFGSSKKIQRRHSLAADNKSEIKFSHTQEKVHFSKNATKIKFTYSEWKSRYLKAKSCPPLEFVIKRTVHEAGILDVPVREIPLPPGTAPPNNCFDLTKFIHPKKKEASRETPGENSIDILTCSNKEEKVTLVTSGFNLFREKHSESQNLKRENPVENLGTCKNRSINKRHSDESFAQNPSQNRRFNLQNLSPAHSEEESTAHSIADKIVKAEPSRNDEINEIQQNKDLNEAERQESNCSDGSVEFPAWKGQNVHLPSEIIKNDVDANVSNFVNPESMKSEIPNENFIAKDEEIKFPINNEFPPKNCVSCHKTEKWSDNSCENESESSPSNINDEPITESETSSGLNLRELEELEEPILLDRDHEKSDLKSACDDIEIKETEEELESEKVEIMVSDSTGRTSFQDDIFTKNGFYECEDIPTSEDLPNGNAEEEKVSDDAKFRHMMQNCLENAKKFLNVTNLKLFSNSVDDLLELDCRSTNDAIENRERRKSFEDSANHIPRDVLLTPCEDGVSDDLDFSQKYPLTDLSMDFIPFFGSSNNLCPEVLPVDNWPYLEEEVPSSPLKPNAEDIIPFLENNSKAESPIHKKLDSKNGKELFNENYDICKLIGEKKLLDLSGNETKFKKFRRKSLICTENISVIKPAKMGERRRKTLESFGESRLSVTKRINENVKDFKLKISELKNGMEKIERFWLKTKDLKCRLNLDKLVDPLGANKYKNNSCQKKIIKTASDNQHIFKSFRKTGNVRAKDSNMVNVGEKSSQECKINLDYSAPTWQPKVVLFRISKKQIKRIQKNNLRNQFETKHEKEESSLEDENSVNEKEKLSRDIVKVLESREISSAPAFKKQRLSSDLESSSSSHEGPYLEKSIEKTSSCLLLKKEGNQINKHFLTKKDRNLNKVQSHCELEKIASNEKFLHGKADAETRKALTPCERLTSINFSAEGDKTVAKKSRFRNLYGKRPNLTGRRKSEKTDSHFYLRKSASPSSSAGDSSTREKAALFDAERRLSEIFKDCVPANKTTSKLSKSDLPVSHEKAGAKRQSSAGCNGSCFPEKKRKSHIEENGFYENEKVRVQSNASERAIGRITEKAIESSTRSEKKHGNKNHSEKLRAESSRRDKNEGSRSARPITESHKSHREKANEKQREISGETIKSQKVTATSKKRISDLGGCEIRLNSKEKHSKSSKNQRVFDDGGGLESDCGRDDDREKTADSNLDFSEDDSADETSEKPWMCNVCGFNNANERMAHIKGHPFHCQSCHLAFRTETHFVSHLTKKHKDIRNQHHCLLCELSFDTEKEYSRHLKTREHVHLETVEKNTINTLFTLLTGQPCPVLGLVELRPEWLPNQAGTVHFYHQATPLSLALQYLKMHHDLSTYSKDSLTHHS